jgi:6-phosphogluconolactonase
MDSPVLIEKLQPKSWDERRNIVVPGDAKTTLIFCVEHFIALSKKAIADHGAFFVALSGGSTPKATFELLSSTPYDQMVDWNKVHLFWSDERAAPPQNPESNYHMAMHAGLGNVPIPKEQIHRMRAEENIEENALAYEQQIAATLKGRPFDLIMLGMGEDGHTASLFPHTAGLKVQQRKVIANYIPEKKTWRMTFTYDCINEANQSVVYVLGASKKSMLAKVLTSADQFDLYPIQKVGTLLHPVLWIADEAATEGLMERKPHR